MRLGKDATIRYTPGGDAVANLSLAYNYGKKDGEGKRPSQWVSATLWGERATKLAQYLLKGQQLCVTLDDIHVETYERREGGTGVNLKARVVSLEFAGSKPAGEEKPGPAKAATGADYKAAKDGSTPPAQPKKGSHGGAFDGFEEDVPFNRITDREAMSS